MMIFFLVFVSLAALADAGCGPNGCCYCGSKNGKVFTTGPYKPDCNIGYECTCQRNSEGYFGICSSNDALTPGTCYKDHTRRRLLDNQFDLTQTNTPELCIQTCAENGYHYAGVQFSYQCFCGNDEPPASSIKPISECNAKCSGNAEFKCGGFLRMNIYLTPGNRDVCVGCSPDSFEPEPSCPGCSPHRFEVPPFIDEEIGCAGCSQDADIDEEIYFAALHATNSLNNVKEVSSCGGINLVRVENARTQIVAGTNYQLTLRLGTSFGRRCASKREKICENIVVFKPLPGPPGACLDGCLQLIEIERISCRNSN
jgi:hypothetical protein